jgi:hypothetical protein
MGYSLTLDVPENVYESLLKTAAQIGQQPEALAVQWLKAITQKTITQNHEVYPLEKIIGAVSSYIPDWADGHDKYLGLSVMETIPKLKERIKQHRAKILDERRTQPLNIDVATILQYIREKRDANFVTNFNAYCH